MGGRVVPTLVMLLVVIVVQVVESQACAQQPPRYVGWDETDPVNIAESQQYAALYFEWQDTGIMPPAFVQFRFTNPAPQGITTPFQRAERMFESLYKHKLNNRRTTAPLYSLSDLLRDDPEIELEFKVYATTGKLSTKLQADFEVIQAHLNAVADAMSSATEYDFSQSSSLDIVDQTIETTGLGRRPIEATPIAASVSPSTPVAETIRSRFPGAPIGPVYWPDNEAPCTGPIDDGMFPNDGFCVSNGHPGFDCDDWALVWAAWLK